MASVEPLKLENLVELRSLIEQIGSAMGFVPNSLLTMARRPDIARAFTQLAGTVLGPGAVAPQLKQLVAHVASTAAGCRYCQAHTASGAARMGVAPGKIEAAWQFENDDRFTSSEKVALRLARDASVVPNAIAAEHFAQLRAHFTDEQIVELVATISLFGWLNRWNDTMATTLEEEPLKFAARHLASSGWRAGKHRAGG